LGRPTTTHPGRRVGRRLTLVCGLALVIAMAIAPAAMAGILLPESGAGSPNADQISSLYKITLYVALVIFIGVEGVLIYALYRFRARKGNVAAQIHGNTRLEIGWTLGAALILIVLGAVTFTKLDSIRNPPNSGPGGLALTGVDYANAGGLRPPDGKSLNILVNGQQFVWRFTYPGGKQANGLDDPYTYEKMVVPINTTVTLDIVSQDVVHSWWIPQLGGKFQAVPGYPNHTWFKISKPGIYRGQCAFICGRLHARMVAEVQAVTPAQFTTWLDGQKKAIAAANTAAAAARASLGKKTGAASVANP
jgi:cytochrome c oxidase subunit 2